MSIFDEMTLRAEEFALARKGINEFEQTLTELIYAVKERLEIERDSDKARLEVLECILQDNESTPTALLVAELEKQHLLKKAYLPTDEETNAFYDCYDKAGQAIKDTKILYSEFGDLARAAREEFESLRGSVMKVDLDTARDRIFSSEKDFERLTRGVLL